MLIKISWKKYILKIMFFVDFFIDIYHIIAFYNPLEYF